MPHFMIFIAQDIVDIPNVYYRVTDDNLLFLFDI